VPGCGKEWVPLLVPFFTSSSKVFNSNSKVFNSSSKAFDSRGEVFEFSHGIYSASSNAGCL